MKYLPVLLIVCSISSCAIRLTNKQILPGVVRETSGLAAGDSANTLWTINDSDNSPVIYLIGTNGQDKGKGIGSNALNTDTEDMAQDKDHLYIGDFGNNLFNRDTLDITRYCTHEKSCAPYEYIYFTCNHPEAPFNFEAMFDAGDSLYLVTKNQKGKFTYLFRLPKETGFYNIAPIDSTRIRGQITGADYDEKNNLLIMTGYRWYIPFVITSKSENPSKALRKPHKRRTFWLRPALQTEAVVIVSSDEIYISAEGNPLHRPALFSLKISKRFLRTPQK